MLVRQQQYKQKEEIMCCCDKPNNDAKDPVCGMNVDPTKASGHSDFDGQTYHFCSKSCARKFDADPEHYTHRAEPKAGDQYVPMTMLPPKRTRRSRNR